MNKAFLLFALFVCTLLAATGCAEKPSLLSRLKAVETAINRAGAPGAAKADCPDLQLARGKYQQAQDAMARQQYPAARQLAEQALVDANLAEIKAKTSETRQVAEKLRKDIRLLQEKTGVASGP